MIEPPTFWFRDDHSTLLVQTHKTTIITSFLCKVATNQYGPQAAQMKRISYHPELLIQQHYSPPETHSTREEREYVSRYKSDDGYFRLCIFTFAFSLKCINVIQVMCVCGCVSVCGIDLLVHAETCVCCRFCFERVQRACGGSGSSASRAIGLRWRD